MDHTEVKEVQDLAQQQSLLFASFLENSNDLFDELDSVTGDCAQHDSGSTIKNNFRGSNLIIKRERLSQLMQLHALCLGDSEDYCEDCNLALQQEDTQEKNP